MMRIACIIITLLIVTGIKAQDGELYKKKVFGKGKDTLSYRIMYPSKYDVNKKYPVILFLHGAGERGSDNEAQLVHGAKLFADSVNRIKYPAFVIFPQCPKGDFWARIKREESPGSDSLGGFDFISDEPIGKSLGLVVKLIDSFARTPQVDKKKIYVGGLSMGGMGTFELLWRKPNFFAAAIPICGGGDPSKVSIYAKNFPIWVFHGGADPVVPVSNSRLMVNSLKAAGANVVYTEYPGVGHDSWNNAFAEPTLLEWLFSH
ncbi:MAG: dienelactone hydrolase family protein [Chitinophagaceae bacterium]|nr:dienelactone hydrolase family protein [Chitinophagaceae bacterium]